MGGGDHGVESFCSQMTQMNTDKNICVICAICEKSIDDPDQAFLVDQFRHIEVDKNAQLLA